MKSILLSLLALSMVAGALTGAEPVQLKDQKQKVSYIIGHNIGSSIADDDLGVDADALVAALKLGLAKEPSTISPEESRATMMAFQQHMMAKQAPQSGAPAPPAPDIKKLSSIIGHNIGSGISGDGIDADANTMSAGLKAGLAKQASQISEADTKAAMEIFQTEMKAKQDAEAKKGAKVGADFLAANKSKPGVKVTASGLQYKVIKSGSGKNPTKADEVTTHYTGTFIDGKKFDSSVDRGEPSSFPVTGVIKGWTEALLLMKEGDKWELFIPYELAYGEAGRSGIPPYSALVFEIELIKVN